MSNRKVTVSWGIKWPGPVDFSSMGPEVTIERPVEDDETFEHAIEDAQNVAMQGAIEGLLDGLTKIEKVLDEGDHGIPGKRRPA